MKSSQRPRWTHRAGNYARTFFVLAVLMLVAGGCGKKPAPAVVSPPVATGFDPARDAAPQPMDLPANPQMQVVAAGQDTPAVLAQLTAELRRYVMYTHAPPTNFEEFSGKDPITYPAAPEGKKYAIAGGQVVLKNK